MGFKKIRYGNEITWELKGQDLDGKRLEKWKFMNSDFGKVIKIINKKYGMGMFIKIKNEDKDLDWALS